MKTRIVIADDHELVRQGIRHVLERHAGWEVVGEASTGREAIQLAAQFSPDMMILDISMPEMNGLDAIHQIVKDSPKTRILVVSIHDSESLIRDVLSAGAKGYLLKSDAARDVVSAVEALLAGRSFFTAKVSDVLLHSFVQGKQEAPLTTEILTAREREIVQLVAEGKANKEIASALAISVRTVETHRSNIMQKLDLHSLGDLIRYAIRNHLASG